MGVIVLCAAIGVAVVALVAGCAVLAILVVRLVADYFKHGW